MDILKLLLLRFIDTSEITVVLLTAGENTNVGMHLGSYESI